MTLIASYEYHVGDLVALDQALELLARDKPRAARVADSLFFSEMTVRETAKELGISSRACVREWQSARLALHSYLT